MELRPYTFERTDNTPHVRTFLIWENKPGTVYYSRHNPVYFTDHRIVYYPGHTTVQ